MKKERTKSRRILRIIGWTLLILLPLYAIPLFAILSAGYTSFMAAAVVKPMAKGYIAATYPDDDLYVENTFYSFKGSYYYADIASRSSKDTHFTIRYDLGWPEYIDDTYSYITDGTNTFIRLQNEYNQLVNTVNGTVGGLYYTEGSLCKYEPDTSATAYSADGLKTEELVLDMTGDFDALGSEYGIIYCVFSAPSEDITQEHAYELISELDKVLASAGIRYKAIEFTLYPTGEDGAPDYLSDIKIHMPSITAEEISSNSPGITTDSD